MIEFTYENGWIKGKTNEETAKMARYADEIHIKNEMRKLGETLYFRLAHNNMDELIDYLSKKQRDEIVANAVKEWKRINDIALKGTQISRVLEILRTWNDCYVNYECDYVDIALQYGTYTIVVNNDRVDYMSTIVEIYDGDIQVAAGVDIYVKENGKLDIKI